ncbi:MAG: CapA family protein [Myxococcota bacterium]|nr:CapA family protein [Myxococcota bacterium]
MGGRRWWNAWLTVGLMGGIATGGLWLTWRPAARPVAREIGSACVGPVSEIVSVGDIMLADGVQRKLDKQGYDYPFRDVGELLAGADLVMGNLEAPITTHDVKYVASKKWSYRQDPKALPALQGAGFDVLALANNHVLDYGPEGFVETLDHFESAGIRAVGGGRSEEEARRGLIIELDGITVGLLAFMENYGSYEKDGWFAKGDRPGCAMMDLELMQADIERLRGQVDVLIVHCHFGRNYKPPTRLQHRMARAIIDMGADVVNGHHPHVAQGIEIYEGKPILYSLGNFTFGTSGRFPKGRQGYGMVARYRLCDGRVANVAVDLIGVNNKLVRYRPAPIAADEAVPVLDELMEPYGTAVRWEGNSAVVELPSEEASGARKAR